MTLLGHPAGEYRHGLHHSDGTCGLLATPLVQHRERVCSVTGWPGNIGVLGNWLKRDDRGRVMAVWATCYQLGSIFAKSFAALMLAIASAAWSFWGASIIMLGVWVLFYLFQRDSPEDVGLDPIIEPIESTDSDAVTDDGKIPAHVMTSIVWMGSSTSSSSSSAMPSIAGHRLPSRNSSRSLQRWPERSRPCLIGWDS